MLREMEISDYQQVMNLWSETEGMRLREADSEENIGKYLERNPNLSFVALQRRRDRWGDIAWGN